MEWDIIGVCYRSLARILMTTAERAKQVYEDEYRAQLESAHLGQYVAIEPDSRTFFLGETFVDAALAARNAFPEKKAFVIRIGHEAAFHMGAAAS